MKKLIVGLVGGLLLLSFSILVLAQTQITFNTLLTDSTTTHKDYKFTLTETSNVTIKLEMNSTVDYDLYVRWDGTKPSLFSYDCAPYLGSGMTEVCGNLLNPGTYYFNVTYFSGEGKYNLTVNKFGTTTAATKAIYSGRTSPSTPVTFGGYRIYSDLGNTNLWARIIIQKIQDNIGNTVDSLVISRGEMRDSYVSGLSIFVVNVDATQSGIVSGTDIVVGKTYC